MRFPEFTEEWETKKLGEILEFKNGINATKEQYGSGYKFINVLDILNNEFITHDKIIGSVNVNEEIIDKFPVNYGDILFQRSSETREEVGTTSVYLDKDKTATFGGFVIRGKKIGEYEPVFLNKSLKTDLVRNQITSKSGGSTRYNIGQEILTSVTLYFPSLNEQKKIASFLSLIDSRIHTQYKIIKELHVLKTTVAKRIFSGEFRFKDENGNEFLEWEEKKLKNIITIQMGQSPDSSSYNLEDIGIPLIQGNADILNRKSYPRQYTNKPTKLCEVGDILLTVRAPVGYVAKSMHHACIGRGVCSMKNNEKSILEFIYQFLLYFEDKWKSIEQGSTFTAVNSSDISLVNILLPSIPEQTKIANFLSSIDMKIDIEIQILNKLEEQKKFLLQQMFV